MYANGLTDVATLKSCLRALGYLPIPKDSRHSIDIDIANLAKFVEDLVLLDTIKYLRPAETRNDYERILGPALKPLCLDPATQELCEHHARKAISWCTVSELFNAVGAIPRSFWTHAIDNTVKYLIFQGLGVKGKYSPIMQKLFFANGLAEDQLDRELRYQGTYLSDEKPAFKNLDTDQLVDWDNFSEHLEKGRLPPLNFEKGWTKGKPDVNSDEHEILGDSNSGTGYMPGFALSREMSELTLKLLWLHYRTRYYINVAMWHDVLYSPHSLRIPIFEYAMLSDAASKHDGSSRKRILAFLHEEANQSLSEFRSFYGVRLGLVSLPPVFVHVLSRAKTLTNIIEEAYEIRESPPAKRYRRLCAELDEAGATGKVELLTRVKKEVQSLCKNLNRQMGLEKGLGVSAKLGVGPMSIPLEIPLPGIVYKLTRRRKPYLFFLRNIYEDLVRISRLGELYDRFFMGLTPTDTGDPLRDEVVPMVRSGHIIEAIKLVRERTGWGLRESKDYVDSLR